MDREGSSRWRERLGREAAALIPPGWKGRAFAARAPGRLDVLGGVGDYSGSLVLEFPLQEGCLALARAEVSSQVRAVSAGMEEEFPPFRMGLDELNRLGRDAFRGRFRWAAYVLGSLPILARRGLSPGGLDVLVRSDLPPGAGLASSAALEVSSLLALCAALGLGIPEEEIPGLAFRVEQEMAGAPCGFMDQAVVSRGKEGCLFLMDCSGEDMMENLEVPPGIIFFAVDTGVRHSVGGRAYERARCAAFMGRKILEDVVPPGGPALLDPEDFHEKLEPLLPERLEGREFLERFPGGTGDDVTAVDPREVYPLRGAFAFPVEERARVERFVSLVRSLSPRGPAEEAVLEEMGDLLFLSHEGYGPMGLGFPEGNFLVDLVRKAREGGEGLYGARVSGGGAGGSVAVLGTPRGAAALERAARLLAEETGGRGGRIFRGSSPGALELGTMEVGT